jgi:sensor histidine kinase regulating citrate/malate metabolism
VKEDDLLTAVCELIRVQKHDILNHLQVIAGYLQMNKMEKARDYLQETIKEITEKGSLMRLRKPLLVLSLMCKQLEVFEKGLHLKIINRTNLAESSVTDRYLLDRILLVIDNWAAAAGKEGKELVLLFREDEKSYLVEYRLAETDFPGQEAEAETIAYDSGPIYEIGTEGWQSLCLIPKGGG